MYFGIWVIDLRGFVLFIFFNLRQAAVAFAHICPDFKQLVGLALDIPSLFVYNFFEHCLLLLLLLLHKVGRSFAENGQQQKGYKYD